MNVPEFTVWERLSTWIAGVAAALVALVWRDVRQRIGDLENRMEQKVDVIDFDRRGVKIDEIIRSYHATEVGMARFTEQMARMVSDLESEKETRSRINQEVIKRLDRITDSIEQRGKRVRNGD